MRRAICIGFCGLAGLAFSCAQEQQLDERNIGVLVEHIAMDSAAATALLRGLGDSYDDAGLRQRIGFKVAAGGAEVLESTYLVTQFGQRAKIMSWHEIIYEVEPGSSSPPQGFGNSSVLLPPLSREDIISAANATLRTPNHFRMKPVGHELEIDPGSVAGSEVATMNLASHRNLIIGKNVVEFGLQRRSTPRFRSWDSTTAMRVNFGRAALVATHPSAAGGADGRTVFVFCTAHRLVPPPMVEVKAVPERLEFELALELVETDAAQALELYELSTKADTSHGAIRKALDAAFENGAAERLSYSRALVPEGKRAKSEPGTEYQYPTAFDPPELGLDPHPTAFEMRALGPNLEVNVGEVSATGMVTANVSARRVRLDREIGFDGGYPSAKQPIFDTMKLTVSVALRSGNDTLIGIVTPRIAPDGEPESERRVLFVLRAQVIER